MELFSGPTCVPWTTPPSLSQAVIGSSVQRILIPFEKVLQVSLGIPGTVIEKILLSRPYLSLGPVLLLLVTLVTLRDILFLLCYVLVLESMASA